MILTKIFHSTFGGIIFFGLFLLCIVALLLYVSGIKKTFRNALKCEIEFLYKGIVKCASFLGAILAEANKPAPPPQAILRRSPQNLPVVSLANSRLSTLDDFDMQELSEKLRLYAAKEVPPVQCRCSVEKGCYIAIFICPHPICLEAKIEALTKELLMQRFNLNPSRYLLIYAEYQGQYLYISYTDIRFDEKGHVGYVERQLYNRRQRQIYRARNQK